MGLLSKIYFKWLLPIRYDFYFILDDINAYEDKHLKGVFNVPFDKADSGNIIKFHINGVELPDNFNEIEVELDFDI